MRRLSDAFRLRTATILDQITPHGSNAISLTKVAAELPLIAIAEIVGVPQKDRAMYCSNGATERSVVPTT